MSVSPSGGDAVLAAKRGLYIINLDNPFEPPRVIQHLTKWEVSDVQWNPHKARENLIATTSNQKALVWTLTPSSSDSSASKHILHILHAHQRAVSDLNWSPFHPDILATCSYDTYVHMWDLRASPVKPANSFCAWTAGATQVKFNKISEWLLASSHDTDVRIWDIRKGSTPVTLITAHMTKIYGIDWSRTNENEMITCSQDRLVKFWDITQPRTCQATIVTSSPVWRARFTPFGNGVMTMPQRRENNLVLWSCDDLTTPVYSFSGHVDVPREFVWRIRGGESDAVGMFFIVLLMNKMRKSGIVILMGDSPFY
ncbi:WD40-repeat-containing domain protein [Blyttiomyces helicus]|uniref:WD40-repeat-containing domain protein n=1 Tax=Blyttiomyces helicus TaxID=388810 RepID=A0A4P9WH24_9FUNG|nr:WD40-repeat-containing domain protein [Blyttiomyces helicus]|eukprot:RKO92121.1 WD40-repeat-containing domain protein [Blyttiomyces helicus]